VVAHVDRNFSCVRSSANSALRLRSIVRPRVSVSAVSTRGEGPGTGTAPLCPGSVRDAMDAFRPAPAGRGSVWPRFDARDLVVKVSSPPRARGSFVARPVGEGRRWDAASRVRRPVA